MNKFKIVAPKMSWEQGTPQEQILLYVHYMKHHNEINGNDDYADAYQTVEAWIKRQMPLWEPVDKIRIKKEAVQ